MKQLFFNKLPMYLFEKYMYKNRVNNDTIFFEISTLFLSYKHGISVENEVGKIHILF